MGVPGISIHRPSDADGFYRRSSGYNEESIDNTFALCDRRNGDTEVPLVPDPLI